MKAAVYYENGPPSVLKYETVPDPLCPADGLLIRTWAISIEGGDTVNRLMNAPSTAPHIVGFQSAGEILEVGKDVEGFIPGQLVVACAPNGSHAEMRAVPAIRSWVLPRGMDVQIAAAVPIAFGTAHTCLHSAGQLRAGETVLLQTGAGGLGLAAIQLARSLGARIVVTASSDERLNVLRALGMDDGINHRDRNVYHDLMELTAGRGADLVVDSVGGRSLELSIKCARDFGRVVMVGDAGRGGSMIDSWPILAKNITLRGVQATKALATLEGYERVRSLLQQAADGEFKVEIDSVYPLSQAALAHARIESRQAVGRVLMVP